MGLLETWMTENVVTDEQLAERVGVSRVQVLRLRSGQNRPSPGTAKKIEAVTGIPASDLIFDGRAA